jgi:hypothetical protein
VRGLISATWNWYTFTVSESHGRDCITPHQFRGIRNVVDAHYLVIGDIAPQAKLERHRAPPLGAVAGLLLGVIGHMMVGG